MPIAAYPVALVLFLAIDLLWLGAVARRFYVRRMGRLMRPRPRWGVALTFYALFVAGLLHFGVRPGLEEGWAAAALGGALFGFFAYLTYDLTALAVIDGFDPILAIADIAWGTVLCGVVAGLTAAILGAPLAPG